MQFDQPKRREFITLLGGAAATAWPLAARAQQARTVVRIGVLGPSLNRRRWAVDDPKLTLGTAHAITSAYADRQSKGSDRKDLPFETRIQFSHLHANALKFRACGARREVRVACGHVGEGALPSDIRLAAVTARMFDQYFTGWKPDREATPTV